MISKRESEIFKIHRMTREKLAKRCSRKVTLNGDFFNTISGATVLIFARKSYFRLASFTKRDIIHPLYVRMLSPLAFGPGGFLSLHLPRAGQETNDIKMLEIAVLNHI